MILSIYLLCPRMALEGRTTPFVGLVSFLPLLAVKTRYGGILGLLELCLLPSFGEKIKLL